MSNRTIKTAVLAAGLVGLAACATQSPPPPASSPTPAKPAAAAPAPAPATPPGTASLPISRHAAANMAHNCFACHGPEGHSPGTIPSLDRLDRQRIVTDLKAFKSGGLPSTVMGRQAKGYTDAEIEAIADYIAGLQKK